MNDDDNVRQEPVSRPIAANANHIENAGSEPDGHLRRSGGSSNDPNGGHETLDGERRSPEASPVEELVPGGQGAEASPFTKADIARQMAGVGQQQQSSAKTGARPEGSTDLGLDPSLVTPELDPASPLGLRREGIEETGGPDEGHNEDADEPQAAGPPVTLAFTDTQQTNLPKMDSDDSERRMPGSGLDEQPVEGRLNSLRFDEKAGNFRLVEGQD